MSQSGELSDVARLLLGPAPTERYSGSEHGWTTSLRASWSVDTNEALEQDEEQEEEEEEEEEEAFTEDPASDPIEDPDRRGFLYLGSRDQDRRRREQERDRASSPRLSTAKVAISALIALAVTVMIVSTIAAVAGTAVIMKQDESGLGGAGGAPGSENSGKGSSSGSSNSRCDKANTGESPKSGKGSDEGDGSDGTGSSGGDAGTEMPPGYLDPEPGQVPGELPLPVGDGEVVPLASCVTQNGSSPGGGTGGNGSSGAGSGVVPGTISDVTPACGADIDGNPGAQAGIQTDAVIRRRSDPTLDADAANAQTTAAEGLLTSGQEAFGARLVADTCLNPQVVTAWMLAEESGTAARGRQQENNNDWLNIAMDGNGYRGAPTAIWSNPTTAADATAGWIAGRNTVPGWSPGLATASILKAAAQKPSAHLSAAQIVNEEIYAVQWSGWVSGNPSVESYPNLPGLYEQAAGIALPTVAGGVVATTSVETGTTTLTELQARLPTVTQQEMSQLTTQDLLDAVPELEAALGGTAVQTTETNLPAGAGPAGAQRMLAAAQAVLGSHYNQGNHDAVSDTPATIMLLGTDCSGFVSYLMGPNGAGLWSESYTTDTMSAAPNLQEGGGTSGHYVTIYNNPNPGNLGHVFIDVEGQWFEDNGQDGARQMSAGDVQSYLESGEYTQVFHPVGM